MSRFSQSRREAGRAGTDTFASRGVLALLGPLMAAVVGAYAYGLWRLRPWVAPLSIAYAFYVPVNLVLFWYFQTGPEVPPVGFIVLDLAIAFTGSIGTALYLAYHRELLGERQA